VCHGVQALHNCTPPLAHHDIKPHNVLLQRHKQHDSEAADPIGSQSHPGDDLEAQPLHAVGAEPVSSSYHAVVMDFGSCHTAHVEVRNRTEALAVQEDAEVSTTIVLMCVDPVVLCLFVVGPCFRRPVCMANSSFTRFK